VAQGFPYREEVVTFIVVLPRRELGMNNLAIAIDTVDGHYYPFQMRRRNELKKHWKGSRKESRCRVKN
jgi:hypothetical protein